MQVTENTVDLQIYPKAVDEYLLLLDCFQWDNSVAVVKQPSHTELS